MTDQQHVLQEIASLDSTIRRLVSQIMDMESTLGAMATRRGDLEPAQEAVRSAQHLLGLYRYRRRLLSARADTDTDTPVRHDV